ncbi:MAG: PucR family transcriptional regulator [Candidatus Dormibacteria bacterium]
MAGGAQPETVPRITLRDAVRFGGLARAELVAGGGGLDREVTWVRVMESPETADWLQPGELLLTVGYALRDDPGALGGLIRRAAALPLAGIAIKPERGMPRIPASAIELADQLEFPLFLIPKDVAYLDIISPLLEELTNQEHSLLKRSLQIHDELTQAVLRGEGVEGVTRTLGNLLGSAVVIEDQNFKLVASFDGGMELDENRLTTLREGGTPLRFRNSPEMRRFYRQLVTERVPVRVPPHPEIGMDRARLIAPVVAGREVFGYISILVGDEERSGTLGSVAVQQAATVYAFLMMKEKAVVEAERRIRGDFLNDLFAGQFGDDTGGILARARYVGFDLRLQHHVAVVDIDSFSRVLERLHLAEPEVLRLKQRLWDLVRSRAGSMLTGAVVETVSDSVVALVPHRPESRAGTEKARLCDWAEAVVADAAGLEEGITVSVAFGGPCLSPGDYGAVYREALQYMRFQQRLGRRGRVADVSQTGAMGLLMSVEDPGRLQRYWRERLGPLDQLERTRRSPLLRTLAALLRNQGNLTATARELHVHVNTLTYRLRKLQDDHGWDLGDPDLRLSLQLALLARELAP